ncbi:MAG TPA: class I SAM-dependent methyltransferase [Burkholderiales bacterium]|nr:class I SAM-dependent methyltransferase [Burkholderiales bacterium]
MNHRNLNPSPWVTRWAADLPSGASVLDLACGHGRHARYLASRGHRVLALDRDAEALATLQGIAGIEILCADIEDGGWPLKGRRFDAVVVANYLYRPLLGEIIEAVVEGGRLVYETFMMGNEAYGKPSNPNFLLRPGELLEVIAEELEVRAFEQGILENRAVVQRICAVRGRAAGLPI